MSPKVSVISVEDSLTDYPGEFSLVVALYGCNLTCTHCFVKDKIWNPSEIKFEYSVDDLVEILKKGKTLYTALVMTGGEPTLGPENTEFISGLANRLDHALPEIKFGLLTNGTNLSLLQNLTDFDLLDYVGVSIRHPHDLDKEPQEAYEKKISEILEFCKINRPVLDIIVYVVETENVKTDPDFLKRISEFTEKEKIKLSVLKELCGGNQKVQK